MHRVVGLDTPTETVKGSPAKSQNTHIDGRIRGVEAGSQQSGG